MKLEPQGSDAAICEEATTWLKSWLPADYYERLGDYRLDLKFRSAYQAAAFDAGSTSLASTPPSCRTSRVREYLRRRCWSSGPKNNRHLCAP
jgi:hypothetical protein